MAHPLRGRGNLVIGPTGLVTGRPVRVRFIPNPRALIRIQQNIRRALEGAAKFQQETIKSNIGSLRSEPVAGNLRRRVIHSSPGGFPFSQTDNLKNSIKVANFKQKRVSFGFRPIIGNVNDPFAQVRQFLERMIAGIKSNINVITDVEYARTLEKGGLTDPFELKRFTGIELINPITTPKYMEKRPLWFLSFLQSVGRMRQIIIREMRK